MNYFSTMALICAMGIGGILLSTPAKAMNSGSVRTEILCKEGYKFLLVYSTKSKTSPTVTQIWEQVGSTNQPAQPMQCSTRAVECGKFINHASEQCK